MEELVKLKEVEIENLRVQHEASVKVNIIIMVTIDEVGVIFLGAIKVHWELKEYIIGIRK